jgi:predicted secreted protein
MNTHLVIVPAPLVLAANTLVTALTEPHSEANMLTFEPHWRDVDGQLFAACPVDVDLSAQVDDAASLAAPAALVPVDLADGLPDLSQSTILVIAGGNRDTLAAMGLVPAGEA